MKTSSLLVFLLFSCTQIFAQEFRRTQGFGGFTSDYCAAITTDHQGFVYMTGYAGWDTQIGSCEIQDWGMYLAKLDANGNCVWTKESTGSFDTQATAVVCDHENNVIVTGYYRTSISFEGIVLPGALQPRMFVVKYNPDGNLMWAKSYGSTGDTQSTFTNSITTDSQGMIYVTGAFNRFLEFGDMLLESKNSQSFSHFDVFLAKLDHDGNPVWALRAGGKYDDYAYSATFDTSGYVYLSGVIQPEEADFGSYLLDYTNSSSRDFVCKVDTEGQVAWVTCSDAANGGFGESVNVTTDPKGNVYACGNYFGPYVYGRDTLNGMGRYLLKLDSQGNKIFIRPIPTSYDGGSFMEGTWWKKMAGIKSDKENNVFITSSFSDTLIMADDTLVSRITEYGWGSTDILVAKYNEIGYPQWAKSAGGTWHDFAHTLAADSSGIYLAGFYSSEEANFGDTVIINNSGNLDEDFFLAAIKDTTTINKCPEINPVMVPSHEVICGNDSVRITCVGDYGSSFTWIINDTLQLFQYSNELWVKDSMTLYVIVNPNMVCPDTSNRFTLKRQPKPLVTITAFPDTIVCPDTSVLLSTLFNPAWEYTWYLDHEIISTGVYFIEATTEGMFTARVNDTLCFDTDSIVLTSMNLPYVELYTDTLLAPYFPFTFTAYGSDDEYTWYFSTDTVPVSFEPQVVITQQGMYYVIVTNYCGSATDSVYVKDPFYEISETQNPDDDLIIYPEHTGHTLLIHYTGPDKIKEICLYNQLGQLVQYHQPVNNKLFIYPVKPGIYWLMAEMNHHKIRKKVLIW